MRSVDASSTPPRDLESRYRDPLALLFLVVVAFVPRITGLSRWWLNPDEGIYYSILTRAEWAGFWAEVTSNAHPPLYYLTLRGLAAITWDFYWLRVFSVLCSVAAVIAVAAVARELADRGRSGAVAGVVAGVTIALAPGAIELSQVMRPYMMQLTLLGLSVVGLLRYERTLARRDLLLYAAAIALALLTHYSSLLALAAIGAYVAWRGIDRGLRDPVWRGLAIVQLVPALVVLTLYLTHIRPLAGSDLAGDALDGWLSPYMIGGPSSAWLAFLGFQHLLAGPWLRAPLAVLILVGAGWSLVRGPRASGILAMGALAAAIAAASMGAYPFGSTRHSAWALAFLVPVIGWFVAHLVDPPWCRERILAWVGCGLLFAAGGPIGDVLRAPSAPWAPTDQVLERETLTQMIGLLDPNEGPELIVMSAQTFYLLLPLYPAERELAVFSPDSTAFHFAYGSRRIVTTTAWDFSTREGVSGTAELGPFLDATAEAFPDLELASADPALLVVGGWQPPLVPELAELSEEVPFLHSAAVQPGLIVLTVDLPALWEGVGGG